MAIQAKISTREVLKARRKMATCDGKRKEAEKTGRCQGLEGLKSLVRS